RDRRTRDRLDLRRRDQTELESLHPAAGGRRTVVAGAGARRGVGRARPDVAAEDEEQGEMEEHGQGERAPADAPMPLFQYVRSPYRCACHRSPPSSCAVPRRRPERCRGGELVRRCRSRSTRRAPGGVYAVALPVAPPLQRCAPGGPVFYAAAPPPCFMWGDPVGDASRGRRATVRHLRRRGTRRAGRLASRRTPWLRRTWRWVPCATPGAARALDAARRGAVYSARHALRP